MDNEPIGSAGGSSMSAILSVCFCLALLSFRSFLAFSFLFRLLTCDYDKIKPKISNKHISHI